MNAVQFRNATPADLSWINSQYDEIGFRRSSLINEKLIIALNEETPIGLGRLVGVGPNSAELGGISVFSQFRGQGVAREIVNHLLEWRDTYDKLYCLPFENLKKFYMSFSFSEANPLDAELPYEIKEKLKWCNTGDRYPDATILLTMSIIV